MYFDPCDATEECHATDTGHDTPPRHRIQTQGRPVVVLSLDVERHTGIHNYPFNILGKTRSGNPSTTFHTHQRILNFLMLVVVSQKLGRKCTVPIGYKHDKSTKENVHRTVPMTVYTIILYSKLVTIR